MSSCQYSLFNWNLDVTGKGLEYLSFLTFEKVGEFAIGAHIDSIIP